MKNTQQTLDSLFKLFPCIFLLLYLSVLFLSFGSCATKKQTTTNSQAGKDGKHSEWLYQGWGCSHQASPGYNRPKRNCPSNEKIPEYIYIPFLNQNSQSGRKSKNLNTRKNTCYRTARNLIASNTLNRFLGDFINESYNLEHGYYFAKRILTDPSGPIQDIRLYECCSLKTARAYTQEEEFQNNLEWDEPISQKSKSLTDHFQCSNPDPREQEKDPNSWNTCVCMVSIFFLGGETQLKQEMNRRWGR